MMMKKAFVGLTLAIILAVGVFGLVKTTYAQDATDDPEMIVEDVTTPDPQTLEYEYMYQSGAVNGEVDDLQTQTRTRLFEIQEGECDADCDPQQLREQIGSGVSGYGGMRQSNMSASGVCDGTGMIGGQGQGFKGSN
jgi:hypothetical protein